MKNGKVGKIQDVLLDRLANILAKEHILKRVDIVKLIGVGESTFNRWKLRQAKPSGLARVNLEKVLSKLEKEGGKQPDSKPEDGNDIW